MSDTDRPNPLKAELQAAQRAYGGRLDHYKVLGEDPYLIDRPARHRDGRWFAKMLVATGGGPVHLRGFHYRLVARGDVLKPDGTPYLNNADDWDWLEGKASAAARWLGYVPFTSIIDARNTPPTLFRADRIQPTAGFNRGVDLEQLKAMPWPWLSGFSSQQHQPFALAIFGEKSSLEDEIRPIAERLGADLYLGAGEISTTHVYDIAARAAHDGRPLMAVTLTDFDPSGRQMGVSLTRKLQALRDKEFPQLKWQVREAALTLDQAVQHELPSTPLKEGEGRGERWKAFFGREQTEIDALLILRPGLAAELTTAALEPFFDKTLEAKRRKAESDWVIAAMERLKGIVGRPAWDDLESRQEELESMANELNGDIEEALEGVTLDPPTPLKSKAKAEGAVPPSPGDEGVLGHSDWEFVEQTEVLRARKRYGAE